MELKNNNPLRIVDGWLTPNVRHCCSPNFNDRPVDTSICLLVIHNISLPPEQFDNGYIEQFFCNVLPETDHPYFQTICDLKVSAHCLVARDGAIVQFVDFSKRAWHAGLSSFEGRSNCNDFSIGIELEGADTIAYTDPQYAALARLTGAIMQAYPEIISKRIVGHSTVSPGRKTDPGPAFDWVRYKNSLESLT